MEYREYQYTTKAGSVVMGKDKKPKYNGTPVIIYVIFKDVYNVEIFEALNQGYNIRSLNNGIYKKILDKKTIAICIVQDLYIKETNSSIDNREIESSIKCKKYSLYIIGANCHYWMTYYEYKQKMLSTKWDLLPFYYRNNKIKLGTDIIVTKSINEIIMKQSDKEILVDTIDKFINNREYYERNHIAYRLGILLEGDPGTGKTSLAYALALKYRAIVKFIGRKEIIDKVTYNCLSRNVILIIDEIDTLLEHRDKNDDLGKEQITSYIDSIQNGQIIIGTTNYIERIKEKEPAIIRPGRFDIHLHMGNFDKEEAIEMIKLRGLDESFADQLQYPICPSELEFLITQEFYNRISE